MLTYLQVKIGDDVEFLTFGGLIRTGTISNIIKDKVYVIPDGTENSIPVASISRIIPIRRISGISNIRREPYQFTQKEYVIKIGTKTGLTRKQVAEAHKILVEKALSEGKLIPSRVLADYLD